MGRHLKHQPTERPAESRAKPSKVTIDYVRDLPIVRVTGRVDGATVNEVSETVRGLVAVGVRELTVDLAQCWDGAGLLTVLARTRADLTDHGGSLRVLGVALPEFLAALLSAPLDEVFLVYDALRRDSRDPAAPARTASAPSSSVQRRTDWAPIPTARPPSEGDSAAGPASSPGQTGVANAS